MNASPMGGGGFRREDGGRGKRGGERRQGSNSFMDNQWKTSRSNYVVDTSKLKAVTQKVKKCFIYILLITIHINKIHCSFNLL